MNKKRLKLWLVLLLALGVFNIASASQLELNPAKKPFFMKDARCTETQIEVKPLTSTQVQLFEFDSSCRNLGKKVEVFLGKSDGSSLQGTMDILSSASPVLTVGSFNQATVKSVYLSVGGWPIRSSWNPDLWQTELPLFSCQGIGGVGSCVIEHVQLTWPGAVQFSITVKGTSPTPTPWQVTINFSALGSPILPIWLQGNDTSVMQSYSCGPPRTLTLKAPVWSNPVGNAQSYNFNFIAYTSNKPYAPWFECLN